MSLLNGSFVPFSISFIVSWPEWPRVLVITWLPGWIGLSHLRFMEGWVPWSSISSSSSTCCKFFLCAYGIDSSNWYGLYLCLYNLFFICASFACACSSHLVWGGTFACSVCLYCWRDLFMGRIQIQMYSCNLLISQSSLLGKLQVRESQYPKGTNYNVTGSEKQQCGCPLDSTSIHIYTPPDAFLSHIHIRILTHF